MTDPTRPVQACPNCSGPMHTLRLRGRYVPTVVVDACHACDLLWFDGMESQSLDEGSIIALFRAMHEHRAPSGRPLSEPLHCPRCRSALRHVHDRQRNTRFDYHRCRTGCGRLSTFHSFLLEKDFIRPLSPEEVTELQQAIGQVDCSNCGAPVVVGLGSRCEHCGTPLSILDPEQVERTLASLQEAAERRARIDDLPPPSRQPRSDIPSLARAAGADDETGHWRTLLHAGLEILLRVIL